MLVGKLECMGQVREEMLCYLQGRKRPDGYFFDLSQLLEAFFFSPSMSVHRATGVLVEGDG